MNCFHILVVDDDPENLSLMRHIFEKAGAQVSLATNGKECIHLHRTLEPDLILLDLMLPDEDGIKLCKRIRLSSDVPIIIMSALKREADVVQGLKAGADDYLTKPYSHPILLARAEAVLRRSQKSHAAVAFDGGRLRIDFEGHQVFMDEDRLHLTPVEFQLLTCLVKNSGKTLRYHQLLENVWGPDFDGGPETVHVGISTLRKKLGEKLKNPNYIVTVPKVGYCFIGSHEPRNT